MGESVKIVLDNSVDNVCYPGQTLVGKVECFFKKKEQVRGIQLRFSGIAKIAFDVIYGKSSITYFGNEVYFFQQYDLVPGGDKFHLDAGQHIYPFSYTLPQALPSPIDNSYGTIKYRIKVKVDRPWRIDYEDKICLIVVSPIDLNLLPEIEQPHSVIVADDVGISMFGSNPLQLEVFLPRTVVVEGEEIEVVVTITNMSDISVDCVKFKIMQIIEFSGQMRNLESTGTKEVHRTIKEWKVEGNKVPLPGKPLISITNIPRHVFPNFSACKFIDATYKLYVTLVLPFPHSNIDASLPITIGTIPFSGTRNSKQRTNYAPLEGPSVSVRRNSPRPSEYNNYIPEASLPLVGINRAEPSVACPYPPSYNALFPSISGRSSPYGSGGTSSPYEATAPSGVGFNVSVLPNSDTLAGRHSPVAPGRTEYQPDNKMNLHKTDPSGLVGRMKLL